MNLPRPKWTCISSSIFRADTGPLPRVARDFVEHEAQRFHLRLLIYLIDEDRQPVLPKHVDFGEILDRCHHRPNPEATGAKPANRAPVPDVPAGGRGFDQPEPGLSGLLSMPLPIVQPAPCNSICSNGT